MLICSPYLSFKSICTLSIHKLLTKPFINPLIFTVAFMLNFLWLFIKWIRWYFSGVNTTSCWRAYTMHTLYALSRALQFSSIVLLYISILESSTNLNAKVVPPYSSGRSVQTKNKNRISNSTESWGIPVFVCIIWAI